MHSGTRILTAALIVLGSACAHHGASESDGTLRPDDRPTVVNVSNEYALPVDVYAVAAGTSYRMGTVSPGIDSHFVLRPAVLALGPVELVAHPAGGEPPVYSGRLLLAPGDIVDFDITARLFNSMATVRQ